MKRQPGRRGSVLLLVVVLLAVISLLAAAAVSFSHSELGAARNDRSGDELLACADVGRQYMVSRLQAMGSTKEVHVNVNTPGIADDSCIGTGPVPKDARCVRSGHIDQKLLVTGVTPVNPPAGGDKDGMWDIGNGIPSGRLGGTPYKLTVHCMDENGRGTEVEFVVKYGL